MKNSKVNVQKIVGIAMFAALAFVVSLVFRFPVMFLTFDAKDAIVCITAMILPTSSASSQTKEKSRVMAGNLGSGL